MKKETIIEIITNMSKNSKVDFGIPEYTSNKTFYIVRKSKSTPFDIDFYKLRENGLNPEFMSSFNGKDEIVCHSLDKNDIIEN